MKSSLKKHEIPTKESSSKFLTSTKNLQEAIDRLDTSVKNVKKQFLPVTGEIILATDEMKDPNLKCDYERFLYDACSKINSLCNHLDEMCVQSVI